MNKETLEKANLLNQKIKHLEQVLECFESDGQSNNPSLIIEYDGIDFRETMDVPMEISSELLAFLKLEISRTHINAVDEFNAL